MKNILVAVDLKEGTDNVLEIAFEQAKHYKAMLWIVHISAPEPDFVGYEVGPQYIRDMRATELKSHHRKLKALSDSIAGRGIHAESLLINGSTIEMLLAEIEKLHVDMVVIGHNNRGFIHKTIFGQTDVSLIEKSKIPIIVVPI